MKNNKPEIRFQGFDEEWEEFDLGNISEVTKLAGFEFTKYIVYSNEGEIVALRGLNVKNGRVVLDEVKYIDKSDFSKLNRSKLFIGDLLLTYVGTVGELAVIPENDKFYLAPNVARIRLNTAYEPHFVIHLMSSQRFFDKKIFPLIATSSQPALSMQNVRKLALILPTLPEQTKIGTFLKHLDGLIALHQQQYDKQVIVKKAMLEKMFPKNGATVPEIRFKGFTGDWEEKEAIEVCSISTGKSNTQDRVEDGLYPFYVRSVTIEQSTKYLFDEEAVLTVGDGVGTGKVYHYVNGKYDLHQRVYRMYNFKGVLGKYFFYYFSNNFNKRVMAMTAKTSVDSVRLEMISSMSIEYPTLEEQEKISSYFQKLDNLLALHQGELAKLKNIKKALLEKMFV